MEDKIIFLIQVYFSISFLCTFILLCLRLPYEFKMIKNYKRTYKDNLHLIKIVIIMLFCFPIIAFYYGLKEF